MLLRCSVRCSVQQAVQHADAAPVAHCKQQCRARLWLVFLPGQALSQTNLCMRCRTSLTGLLCLPPPALNRWQLLGQAAAQELGVDVSQYQQYSEEGTDDL